MESKESEVTPAVSSKSFMALGPTLHYSHENVQICWLLAVTVFALTCLFWSRIATGQFASFTSESVTVLDAWRLDQFALTGASIFEYPWQILVLGLCMGILAVAPILVAQLLSFSHSLPFIVAVFFLAGLPGFAMSLLISCLGVACRPLRFRSRIIAIALCMSPQLLYWGHFGGARGSEPLVWGFSFAPWVCAWLVGLFLAGTVLAIGHFTRYKPGLIWSSTGIVLVLAAGLFETKIGFDELDFQLYVAKNNPEQVSVFHDHSLREPLDRLIKDKAFKDYLDKFFYPTDIIELRKSLKQEILIQIGYGRWPGWLEPSDQLNYQDKTAGLNEQYDQFIHPAHSWWMPSFLYKQVLKRRATSPRMAVTLYYKALLSEYNPDIALLRDKEVLHFYNDHPFERSRQIWYRLYTEFSRSPESLEARWRIAWHLAASGAFSRAQELLRDTETLLTQRLEALAAEPSETDTIFRLFHLPAESIMTRVKLNELLYRTDRLQILIGAENRAEGPGSAERLARFISLDPHVMSYPDELSDLLEQIGDTDGLRDNVLLAQAKLIPDEDSRLTELTALHHDFQNSDAGVEALYELGLLKIRLYQAQSDAGRKKTLLADARDTLARFSELYADTPYADQVNKNLRTLPAVQ